MPWSSRWSYQPRATSTFFCFFFNGRGSPANPEGPGDPAAMPNPAILVEKPACRFLDHSCTKRRIQTMDPALCLAAITMIAPMQTYKTLGKYSIGVGDRFAHQAKAQLRACQLAAERGVEVIPVWNKSNREHTIIGSEPAERARRGGRRRARARLEEGLPRRCRPHPPRNGGSLPRRLATSSPSTWPTPSASPPRRKRSQAFVDRHPRTGRHASRSPASTRRSQTTRAEVERIAGNTCSPCRTPGSIYRHIAARKGEGNFITEVSMDETDSPQTPPELLVILAALADERIPVQTIAPKFTGRFNKGVDYVGDLAQFEKEFHDDLAVIAFAIDALRPAGQPEAQRPLRQRQVLALPDHPPHAAEVRRRAAPQDRRHDLAGRAHRPGRSRRRRAGPRQGNLRRRRSTHADELCAPYAAVIDIDRRKLPSAGEVNGWSSEQYARRPPPRPDNPQFNPHLRQLLHVGFKIAAEMGSRYPMPSRPTRPSSPGT